MRPLELGAFHIPALRPVRLDPIMQIRTPAGAWVDERHGGATLPGPRGWDELLRKMGYTRISRHWTEIDDLGLGGGNAHLCKVVPAPHAGITGHAAAHLTIGLLPTCTSYTLLSQRHAEMVGGLKAGFHSGDVIECAYVAGHRLPHTGLGQPDPVDVAAGVDARKRRWHWLLWSGNEAMLSSARPCGVEGRTPDGGRTLTPCALPSGHESASAPHSWQLTTATHGPARPAGQTGVHPPRHPGRR